MCLGVPTIHVHTYENGAHTFTMSVYSTGGEGMQDAQFSSNILRRRHARMSVVPELFFRGKLLRVTGHDRMDKNCPLANTEYFRTFRK
jgi:hypothetical protein